MGIKQHKALALQVRQPVARKTFAEADLSELAGSRGSPQMPQRQRGLWSFLTWQFVIAPIVAVASSFFIGNGHALATEDQDGRAADHHKGQPDATLDHDQAAARTPDDNPEHQTDASLRLLGATSKAVNHPDGLPHEEHAGPAVAREIVDATTSDNAKAATSSGIVTAALSSDASGISSGSPTEISQQIVIGEPASGGLHVDVPVGAELNLVLADVVSTLTGSLADILATVGLDSSLDLKDLLGFDLHVNANGEFIAADLGAVLDLNPSSAISSLVSTVANPVSSVVTLVADGLPILDASNPLDDLLGGDNHNHSVVGHLGDLTSLLGRDGTGHALPGHPGDLTSVITSSDIGGADPISALVGKLGSSVLSSLPAVGAVSDPAHLSIVVDIMPGHSIDFSTPAPRDGDVLFHGNSYTDYHVALQSAGPSPGIGGIASTLAGVSGIPDATPLTHVDAPVAHAAPSTPTAATAQHPDVLLTHISTTLDDLSLHGHTLGTS
jgi:hypothetical protein